MDSKETKEFLKKLGGKDSVADGVARITEIIESAGDYKLTTSEEILEQVKQRPHKKLHSTGIAGLDDIIGGFREQQMIGVAAHSGHGKTATLMHLTDELKELEPVVIPLEQSAEELVEQYLDNGYEVPHFLTPRKTKARVRVDWIEERLIEAIYLYNTRIVFVDHLGYVDADPKYDRDRDDIRIERKLQEIKYLAKKWNVIIVVLIHITQIDEGIPPSLVNLKGSAAIRQECDTVILLWRKNTLKRKIRVYEDKILMSVQKNRRTGKNGNLGLCFNRTTGRYEEDNDWVKSMEETARQEIDSEEAFEEV